MNSTKTGNVPLSGNLSLHAKKAQHFYGLHSASLISLGQLCDNDCIAILDKNKINILKYSKLMLKGHQNKSDGLWYIPISKTSRHRSHGIITRDKTKTYLIQYLQVCWFSPKPRTFMKVIKNGNFLTWPRLNNQTLLKYLPPSIATVLGQLYQERKNLQ